MDSAAQHSKASQATEQATQWTVLHEQPIGQCFRWTVLNMGTHASEGSPPLVTRFGHRLGVAAIALGLNAYGKGARDPATGQEVELR